MATTMHLVQRKWHLVRLIVTVVSIVGKGILLWLAFGLLWLVLRALGV